MAQRVCGDAAPRRGWTAVLGAPPPDDDEAVVVGLAKTLAAYRATLNAPRTAFDEFRVPGLRQLAHTAPCAHNGNLATIEEVARHHSELNEQRLHADGERILRRLDLSA